MQWAAHLAVDLPAGIGHRGLLWTAFYRLALREPNSSQCGT